MSRPGQERAPGDGSGDLSGDGSGEGSGGRPQAARTACSAIPPRAALFLVATDDGPARAFRSGQQPPPRRRPRAARPAPAPSPVPSLCLSQKQGRRAPQLTYGRVGQETGAAGVGI